MTEWCTASAISCIPAHRSATLKPLGGDRRCGEPADRSLRKRAVLGRDQTTLDAQLRKGAATNLIDAETEVAGLGKVLVPELVLLDLKTTLQDLQRFLAPHGAVHGDLLVTPDRESPDCVPARSRKRPAGQHGAPWRSENTERAPRPNRSYVLESCTFAVKLI